MPTRESPSMVLAGTCEGARYCCREKIVGSGIWASEEEMMVAKRRAVRSMFFTAVTERN